jgi:hypothetical protein
MIVLGADTHDSSHTIAAVEMATGQLLGDKTVQVGARGFAALLVWARAVGGERVWALEDCRHVSGALERLLIGRGERVVRVSTRLMARTRRSSRARGKSDQIDAISVARAAWRPGSRRCRPRRSPARSSTCGCWSTSASASSAPGLRSTARCSGTCTTSGPELTLPGGALFAKNWSAKIARRPARAEQTMRVRIARDELRRPARTRRPRSTRSKSRSPTRTRPSVEGHAVTHYASQGRRASRRPPFPGTARLLRPRRRGAAVLDAPPRVRKALPTRNS